MQKSLSTDQEECVRAVAHSTAGRLGVPTAVTAVERSQANGRAEQRVGLRERLHITVQDVRRTRAEVMFGHLAAQRAVRHAELIHNFSVKSDVRLSGGGTIKRTFMRHTGDTAPSSVAGFLDWVLVRSRTSDDKHPMFSDGHWDIMMQASSPGYQTGVWGVTDHGNTFLHATVMRTTLNSQIEVSGVRRTQDPRCKGAWHAHMASVVDTQLSANIQFIPRV